MSEVHIAAGTELVRGMRTLGIENIDMPLKPE